MDYFKTGIKDIAAKSGLSIATVSRVLNGKSEKYRISKKSQQKIQDTAKELNYVPNHFAANLRSGKSNAIALIVPSLNNPFFAYLASAINFEVRKYRYITMISDSDETPEIEETELEQMVSRNIEGLIIAPCGNKSEKIKKFHDQGLPIICIDRYFEELDIPYVSTDNYNGAFTATQYLIDNGHSKIACIQGIQQSTPNRLRVNGFTDALNNAGLTSFSIVGNEFTIQNGYLETRILFQQKEKPTAIITLSNTIAMGCVKCLRELNLRIPEDVSLITFDDHPYLDYFATPLTCIAQPVSDISNLAVKILFSKLENHIDRLDQILLKPEMIIKKSVRKIT